MKPADSKADRLLKIEALLLAHPEGLSQAELARLLGVNRSTVGRYLPDLPGHIYLDVNRWFIDRAGLLVNLRLNLHESLALHLAVRLLATRMDRQNPHAAAAVRKLGLALQALAPRFSYYLCQSANDLDDPARRQDPIYIGNLEKLTLAWAELRKVQVWYHGDGDQVKECLFSPYFIEPYAIGQATYAIGYRQPPEAVRTFKIERLLRVEPTRETYQIDPSFDPAELLTDAWGIWYTDEPPVEVVLRFSPEVASRVRELRWHRSEVVEEQADGSLLWKARIAETQEMLPWIRGWGADCEVITPIELRHKIAVEAQASAEMYREKIR